jgi:glycerol-3-phosphate dehydrogenase
MQRFLPRLTAFRATAGVAVGCGVAYVAMLPPKPQEEPQIAYSGAPLKKKIQRFNSLVNRGDNPETLKSRSEMIQALKSGEMFDIVIVGAGCTGSGAALDATTRGLKTACIERGDFANETSSRSSKLIWGGFKYLQVAFAELLNTKTLMSPVSSFAKFWGEFMMVVECCQERSWLAGQQPHLVEYVPQAVPFKSLVQWPPYFNHPFYSILPILAMPAFIFYDMLAGFHAPLAHPMTAKKTRELFPQLQNVIYSAVYCEAMHNDARTGTAIALTAALKGATIANYVEMVDFVHGGPDGATVTGIKCKDNLTGEMFEIKATAVVLATGPFLDSARRMLNPNAEKAVAAGAGCHIVLPGYFTPGGMGFCELRNSRGATMYFLPWLGNTVVGSTDKKSDAVSSPGVTEDEIQYLVNEAANCLSSDIRLRRSDVLSAWQGWRPLYRDPEAPPGAPVSRHHVIGLDSKTGVTFICGGKWSTYRAMAEELIDKVIGYKNLTHAGPCVSKHIKLLGGEGFHSLLHVQLVQNYNVSEKVAKHLAHAYGTAAFKVCELAKPSGRTTTSMGVITDGGQHVGKLLAPDYPMIEAEVIYACRHEMCKTVKDMLTTRTRLAYLNSEAAKQAINKVADVMAAELKWTRKERDAQIKMAWDYIKDFGGPVADKSKALLKSATFTDLHEVFVSIDKDKSGYIDMEELNSASIKLGFPMRSKADLTAKFNEIDTDGNGKISEAEFVEWWNGRHSEEYAKKLARTVTLTATSEVALDKSNMMEKSK